MSWSSEIAIASYRSYIPQYGFGKHSGSHIPDKAGVFMPFGELGGSEKWGASP